MAGYDPNKVYGSGDVTAAYLRRASENAKLSNGTNALEVYRRLAQERGVGTGAQGTVIPSVQAGKVQTGRSRASVGGRVAATGLDVVGQVLEGLGRGVEGVVDFALGLVTMPAVIGEQIGSAIAGRDGTWDDAIKDIMEFDVTSSIAGAVQGGVETVTGLDVLNDSYQAEGWGQYAREIEQGIGMMLPAVAVTIATGGAGAPAAVSEFASLATLGAGAAGQAAQESFAEGASYGEGMAYGTATGVIEAASEKMFGGVNKVVSGTGFLDDVVPSVAKKGAARIAANFVEEGAEEVVSDLLNPLAKTIYQGKDALGAYGTQEYWQDMGKSFLVGGATATVYSGTVGYGLSRAGHGYVGKEADVESLLEDIDGLARKERNARAHGTLTDDLSARIHSEAVSRYADIQDILTSGGMKESRRAKIIDEFSLGKAFDADGRMSRAFGEEIGFYHASPADTGTDTGGTHADGSSLHAQYYAGRRANVEEALRSEGMTPVQSLTAAEQEGYRAFLKAESRLESLIGEESPFAGDKLSFAIVEPDADGGRAAEGAYVRGQRTILLSREALADPAVAAQELQASWFGVLIEESLHMANDTPGLTAITDADGKTTYTSRYLELKELLWDGKDSVIEGLLRDGYFREFGKNQSEIKKTIDRLLNKRIEKMSDVELQQRELLFDEVIAHLGRDELSTKHFYERLVKADPTAAERILDRLRAMKEKLSRKQSSETVEVELSERAKRAEELFLEAMSEAGVQVSADGKILDGDRQEDEEESAQAQEATVRYSRAELNKVVEEYGIRSVRALNDYVGVQKKVMQALTEDGFFENGNNIVYNEATGYKIEIGKKGIREAFGPEMRFQGLSTDLKKLKLATIRDLPEIIRHAKVLTADVPNMHNSNSSLRFDYLEGIADVLGDQYKVKIVVRKSQQKNLFYLHEVQIEMGASLAVEAQGLTTFTKGSTTGDSIAQERADVNPSDEKNVRTAQNSEDTVRYSRKRVETVAEEYGIRALNDYVDVQKKVVRTLREQGFFENGNNIVFNEATGYEIEIGKKGIEETFGPGKRYERLSATLKKLKLATVRDLPEIIRNARVLESGVENTHNSASQSTFDYLEGVAEVSGESYRVKIVVKRSALKNKFYLHEVQLENGAPHATVANGTANDITVLPGGDTVTDSIAQERSDVNPSDEKNVRTARKKGRNADSRAFEDAVRRMEESDIEDMVERDFEDAVERIEQHEQEVEQAEAQVQAQGEASEGMSDSLKSYSRKEAREMMAEVNRLLTEQAAEQFGDAQKTIDTYLRWGNANRISEALWLKLNSVETAEERTKAFTEVAEQIVRDSRLRVVLSEPEMRTQQTRLAAIQGLKGKLDLSAISAEIERHFGDEASRVTRYWRAGKGKPSMTIQEAVKRFTKKTNMEIDTGKDAIELLVQLEGIRQEAIETLYTNTSLALGEELSRATVEEGAASPMDEAVRKAAEILEQGWSSKGTRADRARIEEAVEAATKAVRASERIKAEAKKLVADQRQLMQTGRKLNAAKYKAERIKTWKSGEFRAASEPGNADLLAALGSLGAADQRGNFSPASARKAMAKVADWYAQPAVQSLLGASFDGEGHAVDGGMWRQEMLDKMRRLAEGRDANDPKKVRVQFTLEDADDLNMILDHARKIVEEAYYVRVGGKRVKAREAAERYAGILAKQGNALRNTMFGKVVDRYRIEFYDPASLMRWFDGYAEHGFLQDMHAMFRQSEFETDIIRAGMAQQLVDFENRYKGYFTKAAKRSVTIEGCEVPLMSGLYLTLALEREQAVRHLMEGGFRYQDAKGNDHRVGALLRGGDTGMEAMQAQASELRADIMSQLGAEDKAFLDLARKLFNEDCKEHKRRTDLERFGYTNVLEGAYIPIRIADKAIRVDTADYRTEIDRATNASFNKNTNEHAANAIIAGDLLEVLTRHIDGIARYAGLSESIRTYETLLNIDTTPEVQANADKQQDEQVVGRRKTGGKSVRRVLETVWPDRGSIKGAASYLNDMVSDIQHISPVRRGTSISQALEWVRGRTAVAVLGANPKVLATQFSSLFAASSILDAKYIRQGMVMKADRAELESYCKLAYLRRIGNDSVRAQGVVDQISKVGEFSTALIGKTDSFVVDRLWNACLLQAAEQTHTAIDSEVCKRAAGELLTDVIYETQQNAQMSERSYAMRSGNFIDKVVTMFSADSMKIVGRVLDAAGAYKVAKRASDTKAQQAAAKQYRRAVGALASQAVYMAVVATLFRKLLAYDDDDTLSEWSTGDIRSFLADVLSSAVGGLPIIKECVEFFQTGYDIEDMGVGALNDLLSAVKNVVALPKEAVTGELTGERAANRARSLLYSLGQITGIPLRNVYKYSRGVLNVVDDVSGSHVVYSLDSVFDKSSLSSDLAEAIEKGDTERARFIAGLALDERVDLAQNAALRQELTRLCAAGASVLPRSVGNEVTWDGETYQLTARQKKRFETVYSEASDAAARLIKSSYYKEVSDTIKAKALKRIYEIYYNLAVEDFLGIPSETRAVLFSKAIPAEKLAVVVAAASELNADTDSQGRVISGSRRRRVAAFIESLRLSAAQKYMIFAYLGYRERSGKEAVVKYINTLELEKGEKELLLQWCGYVE